MSENKENKKNGSLIVIVIVIIVLAVLFCLGKCSGFFPGAGNGSAAAEGSGNTEAEKTAENEAEPADESAEPAAQDHRENAEEEPEEPVLPDKITVKIVEDKVYVENEEFADAESLKAYIEEINTDSREYYLEDENSILDTYEWVKGVFEELKIPLNQR